MCDVRQIRAARARKILENSESRLMKITGRTCTDIKQTEKVSHCLNSDDRQKLDLDQNIDGIHLGTSCGERSTITGGVTCSDSPSQSYTYKNEDTNNKLADISDDPSSGLNCPEFDNLNAEPDLSKKTRDTNSDLKTSDKLPTVLTKKRNYIILAAIINALIFLDLDYIYGKAILIPFFTVMVAQLCIHGVQESQKGSLLIAAMILCNIKPELVYNMRRITNLFNILVYDLALYIFSFVFMYSILSWYTGNFDTAFPSVLPDKYNDITKNL